LAVERFDEEAIRRLQHARLRKLLRYVLRKSSFYRNYYGDHGITEDNIRGVALQDLPAIDKPLVMEHFDDLVCDPAIRRSEVEDFLGDPSNRNRHYKQAYQVVQSSGSTGAVGIYVYNAHGWSVLRALTMRRIARLGIHPFRKPRVVYLAAIDGHYAGLRLVQSHPRLCVKTRVLSINSPEKDLVQSLNTFQPDMLSGYASGIYLMAQEQLKGNLHIAISKAICSGDTLTPSMRNTIREAFNIEPTNLYAASESVSIAAECSERDGLHLFNDWHCCELVNQALEPVPVGQPGALLLTNLYNYTQPLIRYHMNDVLTLREEPCPCGLALPRINGVEGRREEFLWFKKPGGANEFIHPIVLVEFYVPGLQAFQFIQTSADTLHMKARITGDKNTVLPAIHNRMIQILTDKGLQDQVHFNIQCVDHIPNNPKTGKFKLIIPHSTC
jgi:phenylacetate-coenzyme A ligase PaaK-like adenylate-forming protein